MANALKKTSFLGYVKNGLYLFCSTYVFTHHVGELIVCTGDSMLPTMHSGDICVAEKLSVKRGNIQKGDIICATNPYNERVLFCKRVGHEPLEPILYEQKYEYSLNRVPPGHIFLVGDNQQVSNDSREFGPIPLGLVQVRLVYRIWPLNRLGWISTHSFNERSN